MFTWPAKDVSRPVGAFGALLVVLTAYCQLHSMLEAERIPITVSLSWASVTTAAWAAAAVLIWRCREPLLAMLSSHRVIAIAHGALLLFVVSMLAASINIVIDVARAEVLPSELLRYFLRYAPAAAASAAFAACLLLLLRRPLARPTSEWLDLPQEPRLLLRNSDVRLIRSAGNYCEIHAGTRVHLVRATLKDLEAHLGDHGFVRVHRTAMVNVSCIAAIAPTRRTSRLHVELHGGGQIPVGRAYASNLRNVTSCVRYAQAVPFPAQDGRPLALIRPAHDRLGEQAPEEQHGRKAPQ